MRSIAMIAGLTMAIAAAPAAEAACQKRTNGTVIGALGGALLGNTVAARGNKTEGALLGAGVGGLAGHEIGKNKKKCHYEYRYR